MNQDELIATIVLSILAIPIIVLLFDILRVFYFVRWYHVPRADPVKVAAYRKKMEDAYFARDGADGDNPFRHVVSDEEFEASLTAFEREMDAKNGVAAGGGPTSIYGPQMSDAYLKLLRESIGVVIAPRAVILQTSHPFIAVGIKQHSNVVRDTPRRFERTYYHMFTMAFATRAEAIQSARNLRRIHNKVVGSFEHQVNPHMPAGYSYTAAHTHAMLWVGLALAESVTFGYEALVRSFTAKEKEELARDAAFGMMLFGIPKSLATGTYADFRVAIEACWLSEDVICITPEAEEIIHHLLYPRKWYLKPVFAVARYATMVILPPRIAQAYFSRRANILDHLIVGVGGGLLRFLYRLTPGWVSREIARRTANCLRRRGR